MPADFCKEGSFASKSKKVTCMFGLCCGPKKAKNKSDPTKSDIANSNKSINFDSMQRKAGYSKIKKSFDGKAMLTPDNQLIHSFWQISIETEIEITTERRKLAS
ncbi:hypothetical protein BTUL_0062g00050 [Botrytis tulipae]|uniref:Uncharacterized protein n=1 Tax=Botrytis tulipae TaxID=87230 RepID=A0A4Z1ESU9_9HELO|nr:hypothetical protein BTUL_0062g00050 [Botrytis tulipae]